jgi:hypothetical protein
MDLGVSCQVCRLALATFLALGPGLVALHPSNYKEKDSSIESIRAAAELVHEEVGRSPTSVSFKRWADAYRGVQPIRKPLVAKTRNRAELTFRPGLPSEKAQEEAALIELFKRRWGNDTEWLAPSRLPMFVIQQVAKTVEKGHFKEFLKKHSTDFEVSDEGRGWTFRVLGCSASASGAVISDAEPPVVEVAEGLPPASKTLQWLCPLVSSSSQRQDAGQPLATNPILPDLLDLDFGAFVPAQENKSTVSASDGPGQQRPGRPSGFWDARSLPSACTVEASEVSTRGGLWLSTEFLFKDD